MRKNHFPGTSRSLFPAFRVSFLLAFLLVFSLSDLWAFCGFYVAKTDATLFNTTSQVIIVRDGTQSVVTMSSDFKGDVKDFAMVVPVPEVLKKNQVRTVRNNIFTKSDAYSGPRLVEYHDPYVCPPPPRPIAHSRNYNSVTMATSAPMGKMTAESAKDYRVTVVEEFSVDEYDIVILSAEESDGLERWLTDHGYKIPEGAKEVLEPYVKSDMKFFVVKVNLDHMANSPSSGLNPIQITYNSNNFMLPIRLGMANASGDQDMLVYTFTKKGRVETTNYRTTKIPTDRDIPLFVRSRFGEFYKDLFQKAWKKEGKNTVWLEYAWDISATNPVKCDPCNAALFTYQELQQAGVGWVKDGGYGQYKGDLFLTRLHVRYNRENFPQDLAFQITPNTENFQGRYILRNPSPGPFTCEKAPAYLHELSERRSDEVHQLAALTGWKTGQFADYIVEYDQYLPKKEQKKKIKEEDEGHGLNETTPDQMDVKSLVKVNPILDQEDPASPGEEAVTLHSSQADSFVPAIIEKAEDPNYMVTKAEPAKNRNWLAIPLILIAIFTVLGISKKKKSVS